MNFVKSLFAGGAATPAEGKSSLLDLIAVGKDPESHPQDGYLFAHTRPGNAEAAASQTFDDGEHLAAVFAARDACVQACVDPAAGDAFYGVEEKLDDYEFALARADPYDHDHDADKAARERAVEEDARATLGVCKYDAASGTITFQLVLSSHADVIWPRNITVGLSAVTKASWDPRKWSKEETHGPWAWQVESSLWNIQSLKKTFRVQLPQGEAAIPADAMLTFRVADETGDMVLARMEIAVKDTVDSTEWRPYNDMRHTAALSELAAVADTKLDEIKILLDGDTTETKDGGGADKVDNAAGHAAGDGGGEAKNEGNVEAAAPAASQMLCGPLMWARAITHQVNAGAWERSLFSESKDDDETGCFRSSRNLWFDLTQMRVHIACQLLNRAARLASTEQDGGSSIWVQREMVQTAGRYLDRVAAGWKGIDAILSSPSPDQNSEGGEHGRGKKTAGALLKDVAASYSVDVHPATVNALRALVAAEQNCLDIREIQEVPELFGLGPEAERRKLQELQSNWQAVSRNLAPLLNDVPLELAAGFVSCVGASDNASVRRQAAEQQDEDFLNTEGAKKFEVCRGREQVEVDFLRSEAWAKYESARQLLSASADGAVGRVAASSVSPDRQMELLRIDRRRLRERDCAYLARLTSDVAQLGLRGATKLQAKLSIASVRTAFEEGADPSAAKAEAEEKLAQWQPLKVDQAAVDAQTAETARHAAEENIRKADEAAAQEKAAADEAQRHKEEAEATKMAEKAAHEKAMAAEAAAHAAEEKIRKSDEAAAQDKAAADEAKAAADEAKAEKLAEESAQEKAAVEEAARLAEEKALKAVEEAVATEKAVKQATEEKVASGQKADDEAEKESPTAADDDVAQGGEGGEGKASAPSETFLTGTSDGFFLGGNTSSDGFFT